MIMYGVKLGGKLWVSSNFYNIYPSTSANILGAKLFKTPEEAEMVAKRAMGGKVVAVKIMEMDEEESEADMLRASIKQLQKERDAALNELNLYKLNHPDNKEI